MFPPCSARNAALREAMQALRANTWAARVTSPRCGSLSSDVVVGARPDVGVVLEEGVGGCHPRAHVGAAVPPHVCPDDCGCRGVLMRR